MSTKVLKKITNKNIGLTTDILNKVVEGMKPNAEAQRVMEIVGKVQGMKSGSTHIGPFTEFIGDFRGHNLATDEQYIAKSFIPSDLGETILKTMCAKSIEVAKQNGDEGISVTVGIAITVKPFPNEQLKAQYELLAEPLTEIKDEDDPMKQLLESVGSGKLIKLPAPKK